ncbi:MAG: AAA family ATPase [Candidatus Lokiarchaeota archaeon]|nr:AAA family ATPase [Candidatus Lokiarchaeota archaeon]
MSQYKIISFLSAPGGVGKTSIALLLGWFLKQDGNNNLLLDLDPSLGLTLKLMKIQTYYHEIENKKKTSADLLKKISKEESTNINHLDYISSARFKAVKMDFIGSSIRLEDVMGDIWYGTSLGRRKKLKEAIEIIPGDNYEYVLIDVIPCYGLKYALLNLVAADYIILPLRTTLNDIYRTKMMMNELQKKVKTEIGKSEFQKKLNFCFNMVNPYDEDLVPKFGEWLLDDFPDSHYFKKFIKKRKSFDRMNTDNEKSYDINNVKEVFEPFYKEFKKNF